MLTIIIFVILSYTDTEGVRELFHRLDEDDSTEDNNSNRPNERGVGQREQGRNSGRRNNGGDVYRRRSRSRSPRNHRHRAYQDNNGRYNNNGNYNYQNMNMAQHYLGQANQNQRYHQPERLGGNFHNYYVGHGFHSHLTNQYVHNNTRCYNCGKCCGINILIKFCVQGQNSQFFEY